MKRRASKNSGEVETVVELAGAEVEVTVVYNWTPGSPGRTYGPPEDCYPPEGPEVDIEGIFLTEDKTKTDISAKLSKETMESLVEYCAEQGEEHAYDAYEAAMEDKADADRERDW